MLVGGTGLYLRGLSLLCRGPDVYDLIKHPAEFRDDCVLYEHENSRAKLSVCGACASFKLEVESEGGSALCFEPILTQIDKYRRHTAYSSLFITAEKEGAMIRFIKRGKDGFCISVAAFCKGILPLRGANPAQETNQNASVLFFSYKKGL